MPTHATRKRHATHKRVNGGVETDVGAALDRDGCQDRGSREGAGGWDLEAFSRMFARSSSDSPTLFSKHATAAFVSRRSPSRTSSLSSSCGSVPMRWRMTGKRERAKAVGLRVAGSSVHTMSTESSRHFSAWSANALRERGRDEERELCTEEVRGRRRSWGLLEEGLLEGGHALLRHVWSELLRFLHRRCQHGSSHGWGADSLRDRQQRRRKQHVRRKGRREKGDGKEGGGLEKQEEGALFRVLRSGSERQKERENNVERNAIEIYAAKEDRERGREGRVKDERKGSCRGGRQGSLRLTGGLVVKVGGKRKINRTQICNS
eukprot:672690-Rhodomonas_salina.1